MLRKWLLNLGTVGVVLTSYPMLSYGKTDAQSQAGKAASQRMTDPFDLYGGRIEFDVWRNGSKIGQHTVQFTKQGDRLIVDSSFQIAVKVLFVTVFKYTYDSRGVWSHGQLRALDAEVNDNGDVSKLTAVQGDAGYKMRAEDQAYEVTGPVYPTTHWNSGILNVDRVLNTLTGAMADVQILRVGEETIETNAGPTRTNRYEYSGDLDVTVWYDAQGRWVKMVFPGRDGSEIEYTCVQCINTSNMKISESLLRNSL